MLQPSPFFQGSKQIGKRTSLSELDRSVVLLKSDADYSYPAENSASQGKREPLEPTVIRDRINDDSRPAWRAYMLRFSSLFYSQNRMLILILYSNLSQKSSKFSYMGPGLLAGGKDRFLKIKSCVVRLQGCLVLQIRLIYVNIFALYYFNDEPQ